MEHNTLPLYFNHVNLLLGNGKYFSHSFVNVPTKNQDNETLTEIINTKTRFVKSSRIEFQSNDGKDKDGKHDKQTNLHKWGQGLKDGLENNLETCR